ncbi:phage infection protein [Pseudomonas fluorescens]|uniref:Phage infection protein n=1 Tax=Pseudomonas fluorescens TaxID=294 RepID=A0A5E7EXY7_PSEFL|nr:phage infection protein [Pseudomonas fluorescens]VVO31845.1 hypothetical protein PS723_05056 [Pseudomonas fluorescens]
MSNLSKLSSLALGLALIGVLGLSSAASVNTTTELPQGFSLQQNLVAEGGADRLQQNRVAEGGSDRLQQNRVAEGGSDRLRQNRATV